MPELQIIVTRRESVALADVARSEAFLEPTRALRRSAVVEGLGHGPAISLLLEIVVTNLGRCIEGFLNVAILQRAKHSVVMIGPHTRKEVGLQFEAYADFVGLLRIAAILRHLLMGLAKDTELVLNMVAHLVSDDVGVCKVAVGPNLALHALKELKVKVDCFVSGAIEGSTGRGSVAATRVDRIAEDDHLGRLVGATHFLELLGPHVFGACEDAFAERHQLHIHLAVVGAVVNIFCRSALLLHLFHDLARVAAQETDEQIDDDTADADATGCRRRPFTATVFHVGAFSSSF